MQKSPAFYQEIAHDNNDYAILELPDPLGYAPYLYYQTVDGKKLIGGYVARIPQSSLIFIKSTPIIDELIQVSGSSQSIWPDNSFQNITSDGQDVLNHYNIRYVIVHKNQMTQTQFNTVNSILVKTLKEKPIEYENDSMIVYSVSPGSSS